MFVSITVTTEAGMEVPFKREKLLEHQHDFISHLVIFGGVIHEIRSGELLASFQNKAYAFDAALFLLQNYECFNLRIGLHAGHAVIHQGKPQGAVVNLASRLPWFSRSGGICLSDQVYTKLTRRQKKLLVRIGHQAVKNFHYRVPLFAYLPSGQKPRRKINQVARVLKRNRKKLNRYILIGILFAGLVSFNSSHNASVSPSPGRHEAVYFPAFTKSVIGPGSGAVMESIEFSVRARLAELSGTIFYKRPVRHGREVRVSLVQEGKRLQASYVIKPSREGSKIHHEEISGVVNEVFEFQDRLSEAIFLDLSR
jgi:hypothetical protein